MDTPSIGPFDLIRPLGSGGQGRVWYAMHRVQRLPVAVKVLSPSLAAGARAVRAFLREVRAVAGLDHEAIVVVLDHGVVDDSSDHDLLVEGSPYLAMELASGTLREVAGRLPWSELKAVLLSLLDGLAHAHARGVVHLDLKPENVLNVPAQGYKLADFGLARALAAEEPQEVGGTPIFMAPEQFRRSWRDFGPGTDLYALGCLAWEMVVGAPPFTSPSTHLLAQAHLSRDPPALQPRVPVPSGLEAWLRRLLEKRPADRYGCAADAAWSLAQLTDDPDALTPPVVPDSGGGATPPAADMLTFELPEASVRAALDPPPEPHSWELPPTARPPLPETWARPERRRPSARLVGAGLGLYGLRPIRLVGRVAERDALWAALREVHLTGGPRAVVLRGAPGVGKSRLARWLAERAAELGAATALSATHGKPGGPRDGPIAMIERHLRCRGLDRPGVAERLVREAPEIGPERLGAWVELLRPVARGEDAGKLPVVRLADAVARRGVVLDVLRHVSRVRPLVLWFDDVQWGREAVALACDLLADAAMPAVVVLTVVASEPAPHLDALLGQPGVSDLQVPPLPAADQPGLVQELLGLREGLAAQVQERTAGNPLFAVQLVGDWVQRGLLEVDQDGFRLVAGADVTVPDEVHDLWVARVDELLSGRRSHDARALEVAAAFGVEVDPESWEAACARAGLAPPEGLVDALERRGLTRPSEQGWRFVHGMLVESIQRTAAEGGRLEAQRRTVGSTLLAIGTGRLEDLGRPLLAAGPLEQALDKLAGSDLEAHVRRQLGRAYDLLGRTDEAIVHYEAALAAYRAAGHSKSASTVLHDLGRAYRHQGRVQEAVDLLLEALEMFRARGDRRNEAVALDTLGSLARHLGQLDRALDHLGAALAAVRALDDRQTEAIVLGNLGNLHREQGQLDRAATRFREAIAVFREQGDRRGEAVALGNLGNALQQRGDLELAGESYRLAIAGLRELGIRRVEGIMLANLGYLRREQGRFVEAEQILGEALAVVREVGDPASEGSVLDSLGYLFGLLGRRAEARRAYEASLDLQRQTRNRLGEAEVLAHLGALCVEEGRGEEAASHLRGSLAIYRSAGDRPGEADALIWLGEARLLGGDREEARAAAEAGHGLAERLGERALLARAAALLDRTDAR